MPENVQTDFIDLQSNTILKEKYEFNELPILYSRYVELELYPNLRNGALNIMLLLNSTYTREHVFMNEYC